MLFIQHHRRGGSVGGAPAKRIADKSGHRARQQDADKQPRHQHTYGVPATQEECDALGQTCANGSCVVLLNHGLLTLGATTHGALMRLYMLERTCELEMMARTMNGPIVKIDDYVIGKAAELSRTARAAKAA